MPLGSAPTSKIDIDFTRAHGIASEGRIGFQPPRQKVGSTMLDGTIVYIALVTGVATVDLVRLPQGTYRVVEQLKGRPDRSYDFALPLSSPTVVQYEDIVAVQPVPAKHQYVSTINGVAPNPVTGNITLDTLEGPAGPEGPKGDKGDKGDAGDDGADGAPGTPGTNGTNGINGTNGVDGEDGAPGAPGRDGVLKAFGTTGMITGTFGPAGDSGSWDYCPTPYRPKVIAAVGDRILWVPGFLHKFDQEAVCDLAAMVDGLPVRFRSSGTDTPLSSGYGALYMHATFGGLRPVWWTVAAEDISLDGEVTLALAFRNNGAGNVLGHASVAGDVTLANAGPGGVL